MPKKEKEQKVTKRWKSANTPFVDIRERQRFGTAGMLTKPLYVPPDIEIAWAESPKRDDGRDLHMRIMQGYDLARPEMVTDDLDKAIGEGLIAFSPAVFTALGEMDGGIGLANQGLLLLFRDKEVGERMRKQTYEQFDSIVSAAVRDTSGEREGEQLKVQDKSALKELIT